MATVINNPAERSERYIETNSSAGWAIAVIVLLAVIAIGAYVWTHRTAPAQQTTPDINLTVPVPVSGTQTQTGPQNSGGASNGPSNMPNTPAPTQ